MESNYLYLAKGQFKSETIFKMNYNIAKNFFLICFYLFTTSIFAQDQFAFENELENTNIDPGVLLSLAERPNDLEQFLLNFYNHEPSEFDGKIMPSLNIPYNSNEHNLNEELVDIYDTNPKPISTINENDLINVLLDDVSQSLVSPSSENGFNNLINYPTLASDFNDQVYRTENIPLNSINEKMIPESPGFFEPLISVDRLAQNFSFENVSTTKLLNLTTSTKHARFENRTNTTSKQFPKTNNFNTTIVAKNQSNINTTVETKTQNFTIFNSTLNLSNKSIDRTTNSTTLKPTKHLFSKDLGKNSNSMGNLKGLKPSIINKGGHIVEKRVHMDPLPKSLSNKEDLEQFHHHHHYHNYSQTFNYYQLLWIGTTIFFIAIIVISILICPKMNKES